LDNSKKAHLHCFAPSVLQTAEHFIWSRHSWLTESMIAAHFWCNSPENTNRLLPLFPFLTKSYSYCCSPDWFAVLHGCRTVT